MLTTSVSTGHKTIFDAVDPMLKDPIPPYLIPNMKKGVNYTSAIMELKGKKILEPEPDNAAGNNISYDRD